MTLAPTAGSFLARQRRTLEIMRAELIRDDAAETRELATPIDERGVDATPSQHPADVADDRERRDLVLTLSVLDRRELGAVEAALERLRSGTYGRCVECGTDIPRERLEVRPQAARDVECERRSERERHARRILEGPA